MDFTIYVTILNPSGRKNDVIFPTTSNEAVVIFLNENLQYFEGNWVKADYVQIVFKSFVEEQEWIQNLLLVISNVKQRKS